MGEYLKQVHEEAADAAQEAYDRTAQEVFAREYSMTYEQVFLEKLRTGSEPKQAAAAAQAEAQEAGEWWVSYEAFDAARKAAEVVYERARKEHPELLIDARAADDAAKVARDNSAVILEPPE